MADEEIFNVRDKKTFEEKVLNNKNPVVVGFFSPSSESSKTMIPRVEQVVDDINHDKQRRVSFAQVDINALKDLSMEYGIKTAPVLSLFMEGKVQDQYPGILDFPDIKEFVDSNLKAQRG
ncbi:hypothetical protein PVAND_017500 [Polypedilum vanderplanki]|uniref:Thioredoxin n=1 Tax=Polypedilum vanderplanki TaxID=319348 RepID=S6CDI1_POLVA|nr:hypothetical protein PVAND_017500 [Polypedilum vanderplanki]BAN67620.1 thioredoxin [Polypedilum vanderplanki]